MEQEITVLLFGAAADRVGTRTVKLPAGGLSDLHDVWNALAGEYPAVAPMEPTLAFAINGEYAERGASVSGGDEIAVLPPVSGG